GFAVVAEEVRKLAEESQDAAQSIAALIAEIQAETGRAVEVVELENLAASPLRFEVDGPVLIDLLDRVEDEGAQLGVIYHSHTRSAPEPSQTDINFSAGWPGVEWLIVGLAGGGLEVRSWLIDDGEPREVAVEVRDDG
ncbi:MAG TPA: methyl-accepting chemotaxis protein, partial [Baekduia sp.]|nr:methyl-accepting chemotaxis protein [Baekduia sp.]